MNERNQSINQSKPNFMKCHMSLQYDVIIRHNTGIKGSKQIKGLVFSLNRTSFLSVGLNSSSATATSCPDVLTANCRSPYKTTHSFH